MAKYKSRCTDCGARRYKQIDETTYECMYCGNIHHVEIQQTKNEDILDQDDDNDDVDDLVEEIDETIQEATNQSEQENKLTYFFLTLFLGSLGVHKFYKGKIFLGFVYLFTHGLFGIGYLVDVINAATDLAKK